ncbi:hypothetical protein M5K25_018123 [Dendrobium thyrsiflorum]|uniref:Uncharacterized protein n=1 Tax=Dendrobium thyrsiflorum TaxID=117978 RepID=A0ABD0UHU2_DENTH
MAGASFEAHGSGDVMFCVIIMWLSVISMIIFSCIDQPKNSSNSNKQSRKAAARHGCGDGSYISF